MVRDFTTESLSHDPIHGYIPFVSSSGLPEGENVRAGLNRSSVGAAAAAKSISCKRHGGVFPSAEHMRFSARAGGRCI